MKNNNNNNKEWREESKKGKIRKSREKRPTFLLIFILSTLMLDFFNNVFINSDIYMYMYLLINSTASSYFIPLSIRASATRTGALCTINKICVSPLLFTGLSHSLKYSVGGFVVESQLICHLFLLNQINIPAELLPKIVKYM